jgi:hypothetical protein
MDSAKDIQSRIRGISALYEKICRMRRLTQQLQKPKEQTLSHLHYGDCNTSLDKQAGASVCN